jgi:hypothetical protein
MIYLWPTEYHSYTISYSKRRLRGCSPVDAMHAVGGNHMQKHNPPLECPAHRATRKQHHVCLLGDMAGASARVADVRTTGGLRLAAYGLRSSVAFQSTSLGNIAVPVTTCVGSGAGFAAFNSPLSAFKLVL